MTIISPNSFDPEEVYSLTTYARQLTPIVFDDDLDTQTPMVMSPYRKPIKEEIDLINNYKENKADVIASREAMLLASITPEKATKANIKDLSIALEKLNTMERLVRGQSTSNVAVLIESIDTIANRRLIPIKKSEQENGVLRQDSDILEQNKDILLQNKDILLQNKDIFGE